MGGGRRVRGMLGKVWAYDEEAPLVKKYFLPYDIKLSWMEFPAILISFFFSRNIAILLSFFLVGQSSILGVI